MLAVVIVDLCMCFSFLFLLFILLSCIFCAEYVLFISWDNLFTLIIACDYPSIQMQEQDWIWGTLAIRPLLILL